MLNLQKRNYSTLATLIGRTKTYCVREEIIDKIEDLEEVYLAEKY